MGRKSKNQAANVDANNDDQDQQVQQTYETVEETKAPETTGQSKF